LEYKLSPDKIEEKTFSPIAPFVTPFGSTLLSFCPLKFLYMNQPPLGFTQGVGILRVFLKPIPPYGNIKQRAYKIKNLTEVKKKESSKRRLAITPTNLLR